MILETAAQTTRVGQLQETLKCAESSHLTKGGSTIGVGWRKSGSDHDVMYVNCNTKLIDTFRKLYSEWLNFDEERAVVFHGDGTVPVKELKHDISMALRYHRIKHLPLLGQ